MAYCVHCAQLRRAPAVTRVRAHCRSVGIPRGTVPARLLEPDAASARGSRTVAPGLFMAGAAPVPSGLYQPPAAPGAPKPKPNAALRLVCELPRACQSPPPPPPPAPRTAPGRSCGAHAVCCTACCLLCGARRRDRSRRAWPCLRSCDGGASIRRQLCRGSGLAALPWCCVRSDRQAIGLRRTQLVATFVCVVRHVGAARSIPRGMW